MQTLLLRKSLKKGLILENVKKIKIKNVKEFYNRPNVYQYARQE